VKIPALLCAVTGLFAPRPFGPDHEAIVAREFIYETAPFPSCHASTIAETPSGLVAAWFGGTAEKNPDVGIWVSRKEKAGWTAPLEVANGVQADGTRQPCWNPVLHRTADGLLLFYKVGPNPREWWGMLKASTDDGKTWSMPRRLPAGMLGPIKNKPVELPNGDLILPSSTEDDGWKIHLERFSGELETMRKIGPLNDGKEFGVIQPTVLIWPGNRVQLLCRSRQKKIVECWAANTGEGWSPLAATELSNPNSGIDAVMLKDGRALLVYNPTETGRTPLAVAVSADGKKWNKVLTLEESPGEYSYPSVIQAADGTVHVVYTWKREKIRHVAIAPARLEQSRP
jgi:predicted neuraminidase